MEEAVAQVRAESEERLADAAREVKALRAEHEAERQAASEALAEAVEAVRQEAMEEAVRQVKVARGEASQAQVHVQEAEARAQEAEAGRQVAEQQLEMATRAAADQEERLRAAEAKAKEETEAATEAKEEAANARTAAVAAKADAARAEAALANASAKPRGSPHGTPRGPRPGGASPRGSLNARASVGEASTVLASPERARRAAYEAAGRLSVARDARQRAEEALRSTMAALATPGGTALGRNGSSPNGGTPARPRRLSMMASGGLAGCVGGEWWDQFGQRYDRSRPTPTSPAAGTASGRVGDWSSRGEGADKESGGKENSGNSLRHQSVKGVGDGVSKPVAARLPLARATAESGGGGIFDAMSDAEEDERERSCAGDDGNGARAHCVEDTMAAKMDAEVGLSTAALRDLLTELVTIRHLAATAEAEALGAGVEEEEEGEEVVEEVVAAKEEGCMVEQERQAGAGAKGDVVRPQDNEGMDEEGIGEEGMEQEEGGGGPSPGGSSVAGDSSSVAGSPGGEEPEWLRKAAADAGALSEGLSEEGEGEAEGVPILTEDVVLGTPTFIPRFSRRTSSSLAAAAAPGAAVVGAGAAPAGEAGVLAQPSGRRLNRTVTVRMHSCRRCTGCEGARDRREQEARRCVALRERIEETLHALVESLPLEKLMLLRPETGGGRAS